MNYNIYMWYAQLTNETVKFDAWEQRKFESLFRKSRIKNIHLKYSESDILSVASMEPSANHRHSSDEYMKSYNVIYINDIAFEGHTVKGSLKM